jgi:hypothetical protein
MRKILKCKGLVLAALLVLPLLTLALTAQQINSLAVSGQPGQANVIQVQGRNYVDVEELARITNGSISFNGDQIVLLLPGSNGSASSAAAAPAGFSRDFLKAGIEVMSQVREWHAALKNAIERSYPITEDWIGPLRRQAQQSLRLTQVAASTDADKNAFTLLSNEFNNMNQLSDKYLAMTKSMNYLAPDALRSDPLEQKLLACGHSLVAMVSSNQFSDDGSCH